MITDGFSYVAVLLFLSAILVTVERKSGWKFFKYLPAVVLLYLAAMVLCTLGAWDLDATKGTYSSLKNSLTYAMIFTMLLRCDIRRIFRLGPKMLLGFFCASFSIILGFFVSFSVMKRWLPADAWMALGALCGSWLGGAGNMIAIQTALDISESAMGYALIIDTVNYSVWMVFLLWVIRLAPQFNRWTRSDTRIIDRISQELEQSHGSGPITFQCLLLILGSSFVISVLGQQAGEKIHQVLPVLDVGTWTVLTITAVGLLTALTPAGNIAGTTEVSNILLYLIVALLASRASLAELGDAPVWVLTGFLILVIHGILMVLLCRLFKLDMFTGAVASLANIGGTASAPVLAGAYSGSLVPVGILMALMGYVIGTPLGLLTARVMEKIS